MPGVVVDAAWNVGDRGLFPCSGIQVQKKHMFLPRSQAKIQYCGKSP